MWIGDDDYKQSDNYQYFDDDDFGVFMYKNELAKVSLLICRDWI